jgi:hypothetical protein
MFVLDLFFVSFFWVSCVFRWLGYINYFQGVMISQLRSSV